MAKQKPKLPARRGLPSVAGGDVSTDGPVPVRRKAKNTVKVKAKGFVVSGAADAPAGPGRPVKRKLQRRKDVAPVTIVEGTVERPSVLDPPRTPLAALVRPRKTRPGAPLGRLERLEIAVGEVRIGARASARTRKLLGSGVAKMAQKVIEEAAETAIEAIRGDRAAFVNESVDLFYNLLALCSEVGVPLASIWAEMDRREQVLGMAEKLPKMPDP